MNWAVLAFLGTTGAAIIAACVLVLFVRSRVNRYHRVDRAIPTPAPLTAVIDPRAAGRLHRRLARAAHTADDIAAQHRPTTRKERRRFRQDPAEVVVLAADVKAHAVELDARIALVARLAPAERNRELRRLAGAVRELEHTVAELARVSASARTPAMRPDDTTGLAETRTRVDHLAQAHDELGRVDADNGLVGTDVDGRPLPPPPLPADADRTGRLPRVPVRRTAVGARTRQAPVDR